MSEQIREQVSAFLDGELPSTETELLLKRLTRDAELRESFGRYALVGEALRGGRHTLLTKRFASRVNLAIDGEALPAGGVLGQSRAARWWRPFAGTAVVAGVAAVAIVAMQQRSFAPGVGGSGKLISGTAISGTASPALTAVTASAPLGAAVPMVAANREAISYTVPATPAAAPAAAAMGRLTNYMFAHSKYSYGLAQRGVLADLLIDYDEPTGAVREPATQVPARVAP
jgi:sigma-E factor negative regulatory protein RseA